MAHRPWARDHVKIGICDVDNQSLERQASDESSSKVRIPSTVEVAAPIRESRSINQAWYEGPCSEACPFFLVQHMIAPSFHSEFPWRWEHQQKDTVSALVVPFLPMCLPLWRSWLWHV